jgi:1-acyl-sn-glycerol-3-phosphate acyltransferase
MRLRQPPNLEAQTASLTARRSIYLSQTALGSCGVDPSGAPDEVTMAGIDPSVILDLMSGPDLDPDDLSGRDPQFIRKVGQPFCDWLRKSYFRAEVDGIEHVPRNGSFIAVANHSGGPLLPDVWLMVSYFWELFGVDSPSYALVHDAAFHVPVVRNLLVRIGALRASRRNAEKVLEAGGVLLITPGGDLEALRSFWVRNRLELGGRSTFVELALRYGVPVLPVVNVGAHEVYFTLFSSRTLAKLTGLERLTRVKTIPLNIGLPWGMWLTGFLPYLPLPAKVSFMVAEPVRFPKSALLAANGDAVQHGFVRISATMQGMLDRLAARRRFPVIG